VLRPVGRASFPRENRVQPRHSPVFPSHEGRFPPARMVEIEQVRPRSCTAPSYPWLIRFLRACRIRARPKALRAPGAFDRQASRKARRKARRREEAVQGEGREVSLVPRNRRQHRRWRSGVAILRVRKERNRTPAEEDLQKAGSAVYGAGAASFRLAVTAGSSWRSEPAPLLRGLA